MWPSKEVKRLSDTYIDTPFPLKTFTRLAGLRYRRTEVWVVESPAN